MMVKVVNEGWCMPCVPEFFTRNNLDIGLSSRYAYGQSLEDGTKVKLLMTVYGEDGDYDVGVVEYEGKIYLYLMDALEKVEV